MSYGMQAGLEISMLYSVVVVGHMMVVELMLANQG